MVGAARLVLNGPGACRFRKPDSSPQSRRRALTLPTTTTAFTGISALAMSSPGPRQNGG